MSLSQKLRAKKKRRKVIDFTMPFFSLLKCSAFFLTHKTMVTVIKYLDVTVLLQILNLTALSEYLNLTTQFLKSQRGFFNRNPSRSSTEYIHSVNL